MTHRAGQQGVTEAQQAGHTAAGREAREAGQEKLNGSHACVLNSKLHWYVQLAVPGRRAAKGAQFCD